MNGVVAAVLSSALGGTAGALTRYVIGATEPVTLAAGSGALAQSFRAFHATDGAK